MRLDRHKRSIGFTLIEVLVVVAILSILAAIIISTFDSLQRNSRDARRKLDLAVIQSALEQYHADQNNYPVLGNVGLGTTAPLVSPDNLRVYLKNLPLDPTGTVQYGYQSMPSDCTNLSNESLCTKYYICARMENSVNAGGGADCDSQVYTNAYEITPP